MGVFDKGEKIYFLDSMYFSCNYTHKLLICLREEGAKTVVVMIVSAVQINLIVSGVCILLCAKGKV